MLELDGVRITQDDFTLAAHWAIPAGALVAVIGPSGAGKSTLLGAVAGFVPVSAGRVLWQGREITQASPSGRPVSILFQDNNLFPHLSVFQNVALGIRPALRLTADERAQVETALARVGLEGFGTRKPAQLSGGQQSRVALARVLLQRKPLVLLDEPFAALGPALRMEMLGLVAEICHETGATLLMVSHDIRDAEAIADHLVLVSEGVAHAPAPTRQMLRDPPEALRRYLG